LTHFHQEVLQLCEEFKNEGVVGIDIAGNENAIASLGGGELFNAEDKAIFAEAKRLGIHRTVHAGEDGPASNVKIAIEDLFAERIGHGYRVIQDPELYKKCINEYNIHFETCPTSSILTGSVPMEQAVLLKHPVIQFAKDKANFSINTDDTTVTGTGLDDEYHLLRTWGFNEVHFTRAVSSWLERCERSEHRGRDIHYTLVRFVTYSTYTGAAKMD
jgi:adenosine deaminase